MTWLLLPIVSSLLLICLPQSLAQNSDLKVESFRMLNPDPSTPGVKFQTGAAVTINSASLYVRSNGPDTLTAATPPPMNYDLKMYISALDENGTMDDPVEVTGFQIDQVSVSDHRSSELQTSGEHFYQTAAYTITYPNDKCLTHSHLCVRVEKEAGATYVDDDPANDINCIKFIRSDGIDTAGLTDCPSEVQASNLVLTPSYANFSANSSVDITFSIDLKNMGGTKVSGGPSNIGFSAFIGNSDSESATIQFDLDDTLTLGSLDDGVGEWDMTTYSGHQVRIQIPAQNCQSFTHLCVFFVDVGGVSDTDTTNNIACLLFGESGIGPIECPGDVPPTEAVVITTPVEVATSPNTTTAGAVTVPQGKSGYVSLHGGAVAGIALGCAIAGAGVALVSFFLRAYMSKHARVHTSSTDGNNDVEKPKIEKSPEKEKLPDDNTTNPEDSNKNGEAKPTPEENMELVNLSTE
ncbi:uncharacterized protein [Ptychodera flava]|uniref:uncharacterized protein n=1 Tax=Ptychodera flava TaxID=63121 RepID=UPI003969F4A2